MWQDKNGDGVSDVGEVKTLAQAGLASINLTAAKTDWASGGNQVAGFTTYQKTDGTRGWAADVGLGYEGDGWKSAVESNLVRMTQSGGLVYGLARDNALNIDLGAQGLDGAFGGAGNDSLSAGSKAAVLLEGGAGNDTLRGGAGDDWLSGGAGSDTLIGGAGDDTLLIDAEDRQANLDGGAGFDIAVVTGSAGVTLDLGAANLEAAIGGDGNDSLGTSGAGRVILAGRGGNDTLKGGLGNDLLEGGAGNDSLQGGGGNDTYQFGRGDGTDTLRDEQSRQVAYTYYTNQWVSTGKSGYYRQVANTGYRSEAVDAGQDTLRLGAGITVADLDLEKSGADLVLGLREAGAAKAVGALSDRVTMQAWDNTMNRIETIEFADGTRETLANWKIGTAGNDNLVDGAGNGRLFGGAGNDTLDGGAGADFMAGGLGDDTYVVDNAADVVREDVGGGTDTVLASLSYTLGENLENLTLTGTAAINGTGNALANTIIGNAAANVLAGGKGNDVLQGGGGNDTYIFNRGDGADTLRDEQSRQVAYTYYTNQWVSTGKSGYYRQVASTGYRTEQMDAGQDTLRLGAGITVADLDLEKSGADLVLGLREEGVAKAVGALSDRVTMQAWDNTLSRIEFIEFADGTRAAPADWKIGTAGNDNLVDGASNGRLYGGAGNDTLDGGAGADFMAGGLGDDTYIVDNAADVVREDAGGGTDTVRASVAWTLGANVENLTLTGTADIGGNGNDADNVLTGNTGANRLAGGAGNDTYVVQNVGDTVVENVGEGTDTVQSSIAWTLGANLENLVLTGTADIGGNGNEADNVLTGNAGANRLAGGAGNDTYIVQNAGDTVVENAGEGTDTVRASVSWNLGANTENLELTGTAAINGTGNALDNRITGNAAANVLDGGAGADTLAGGAGDDTYLVDDAGDTTLENVGEGVDAVRSTLSWALAANVENLVLAGTAIAGTGNTLNNRITGNAAANVLDGGAGADTLVGGAGDDTYRVDNANDVVTENAGEGTDTVRSAISWTLGANIENLTLTGAANIDGKGNAGANVLAGNAGANTLAGGAGNDVYVFNRGDGADRILDDARSSVAYSTQAWVGKAWGVDAWGVNTYDPQHGAWGRMVTQTAYREEQSDAGVDTLRLGAGITLADLDLEKSGADLVLGLREAGVSKAVGALSDRVTMQSWDNTLNRVEFIEFSDGTRATPADWKIGTAGNDNLVDGAGNGCLFGGGGNDTLTGGAGNDRLDGGMGDDRLIGGVGADAYVFGRGYGRDTVVDTGPASERDTLLFQAGVSLEQLWFARNGNDLSVSVIGGNDRLTVEGWYAGNHVEEFRVNDGHVLLDSQVDALVQAMASFAPPSAGQTTLLPAYQAALAPVLAASWKVAA